MQKKKCFRGALISISEFVLLRTYIFSSIHPRRSTLNISLNLRKTPRDAEFTSTKYNYAYFVDETGDQNFVLMLLGGSKQINLDEWKELFVRDWRTWKRWKCNHTKTVDKKHINFVELNYVYQFCFPLMCLVFACHPTKICLFSSRDDASEWWSISRRSLSCFKHKLFTLKVA